MNVDVEISISPKMFKSSFNFDHFGPVQPPSAGHRRQLLWACRPGIKGWGMSS